MDAYDYLPEKYIFNGLHIEPVVDIVHQSNKVRHKYTAAVSKYSGRSYKIKF
jgi:hypothetical protein